MLATMILNFTKMQGLGNDFIVFEADDAHLLSAEQLRKLSNRRTGIGFDQALIIQSPKRADTDVYYRNYNADGSEVEQCGNGARCIATLVAAQRGQKSLRMDCLGGLVHAQVRDDGQVSIDMGVPNFDPASLPFLADAISNQYTLDVNGISHSIGAVSMGNPHAVLTVSDVANAPVDSLGALIEVHRRFPNRVNVGFMKIVSRDEINLRVFERGVGETQACGTGACAAVAIGRKRGELDETVKVNLPGGQLLISWQGEGQRLWMTGPATRVFVGQVEI
ncbi:MAG: diaminopimelate epimerase [Steroidobacter sp.]